MLKMSEKLDIYQGRARAFSHEQEKLKGSAVSEHDKDLIAQFQDYYPI